MLGIWIFIFISLLFIPIIFHLSKRRKKVIVIKNNTKNENINKRIIKAINPKKFKVVEVNDLKNIDKMFSLFYVLDFKKDLVSQLREFEENKNKFNFSFLISEKRTKLEEVYHIKDLNKLINNLEW